MNRASLEAALWTARRAVFCADTEEEANRAAQEVTRLRTEMAQHPEEMAHRARRRAASAQRFLDLWR